jgi:hypothetical protein
MKRVAKGGTITFNSFLNEGDRVVSRNHMLKTASSNMREAAKIGLQSLYADPKEVLEKYKDFDIVKEMQARKGAKLLWVRARAIDADTVNANGDYFSKEELKKNVEIKGEKIPAYKTFEGVPIYTNHKNDDIEQAKGMVVYAEWSEEENCVYCTFFVDEEAYPDIARNIRTGVIHDVSMGCFIAGTQVLTLNGFKNIELVSSEDELLDAEGNLTKIVNKQINYTKTHIHDIQVEGGYGFECTEEHPILAISKEDWDKRSKRITSGNKKPRIYNFVEPKFIEAKDLKPGDLVAMKTGGQVIESDLTSDQAKLLGLFAAEGNYLKYKGEVKEIEFTFSLDEEFTLVQECVDLIKSCFGKDARVYKREPKSTIAVRLYDESISNWFKYHIGQYSYGKTISKELRYAPLNIQKAFVCSWVKGDGCITHKTGKNQGISATTCSIEFAKDITYILTRLGIYHKIYARFENKTLLFKDATKIHSNSKGFDGRHMSFDIEVPPTYASKIASACNFDITSGKIQRKNDNGNYIVRKINANDIKSFNGPVYNFETETHTYSIHNIGVHNCSVDYGICSKCKNKAFTEKDYCECLKKYKGKTHPETSKKIYEENYNLKFIELSCVGDGAFEACEIQEIYDVDDVLDAADKLEKKASELCANIVLANEGAPNDPSERVAYEDCLRVAYSTSQTAIKLAQSAGTLVGGPLLAGQGANQNSTVGAVLQALGIDPRSGLNILDMINLSLNFLEVAVMNMFARKDNVDLTHVGKITKAMADLQGTMQDMIDDGVDVGSGQRPQPINQQQVQSQAPVQPASSQVGFANYVPGGNVGKVMGLTLDQEKPAVGGGVALASNNVNLVWASRDNKREVFASSNHTKALSNNILNFTENLLSLKNTLVGGDVQSKIEQVIRVANERNKLIKSDTPKINEAEDRKQMDHFAKIASEQRKKLAAAVTIDFKVDDMSGNRVVLSTDGSITGYVSGRKANWEPILNESQLNLMENGQGARVAAEMLKEFSGYVKTALLDVKERVDVREEQLEEVRKGPSYDNLQDGVRSKNTGVKEDGLEDRLAPVQTGEGAEDVKEVLLGKAGLYSQKVDNADCMTTMHELIADVAHGSYEVVLEEALKDHRADGSASSHEVMSATIEALGKAVVSAMETPDQIMKIASIIAKESLLPEMITVAACGREYRVAQAAKNTFFNKVASYDSPVMAIIKNLGTAVSATVTASDLSDALSVAVEESAYTISGVTHVAEKLMKEASIPEEGLEVKATPSKKESLRSSLKSALNQEDNLVTASDVKSAISALAMSADETMQVPATIIDSLDLMTETQLIAAVDKAKTVTATDARIRERARREFWGIRTASSKDITANVCGWLADYSTNFEIPSKSIVIAAKRISEDYELAEKLITKAIEVKQNMEKTAAMTVTQDKSESLRFTCRTEDLNGMSPSDDGFDEAFKQKAISVLQDHGFQVDPSTFSFTDLIVSAFGDITATVSTRTSKTFKVDSVESMPAEEGTIVDIASPEASLPVEIEEVMTDSAKFAKKQRRDKILARYAQAAPGMGGGGMGGAMPPAGDPMAGAAQMGGEGPGIMGMTGAPEMNEAAPLDSIPEPGEKTPWGSICPVCGDTNVTIVDSDADCQKCGSKYTIKQSLELVSMGNGGTSAPESVESEAPAPDLGLGGLTAPVENPVAPPPAMASTYKTMFRLSATVDSDVYLRTAMPDFNRNSEVRLPIGMVCPQCGNRNAHKVKNNTFCHNCGNYSKTEVKANKKNPSKVDVNITWID